MADLEFEKPAGCIAEAQYSVPTTEIYEGNQRSSVAEFSIVCALQLGPFHNMQSYSSGWSDGGHKGLNKLRDECVADLERLVIPFCAACPNNPKNKA